MSDILVTASGFFFFKEELGPFKKLGVIFSLLALFLMSVDEKGEV